MHFRLLNAQNAQEKGHPQAFKLQAALLLYPVRESNASLILRRDSFYPSELTRLISACEYSNFLRNHQAERIIQPTRLKSYAKNVASCQSKKKTSVTVFTMADAVSTNNNPQRILKRLRAQTYYLRPFSIALKAFVYSALNSLWRSLKSGQTGIPIIGAGIWRPT